MVTSREEEAGGAAAAAAVAEASAVAAKSALSEAVQRNQDLSQQLAESHSRLADMQRGLEEAKEAAAEALAASERRQGEAASLTAELRASRQRVAALQRHFDGEQDPADADGGEEGWEEWQLRQASKWKRAADESTAALEEEAARRQGAEAQAHRLETVGCRNPAVRILPRDC